MEYSEYLSKLIKFSGEPKLVYSNKQWIRAIDHMRALEEENQNLRKELKDVKRLEA